MGNRGFVIAGEGLLRQQLGGTPADAGDRSTSVFFPDVALERAEVELLIRGHAFP